MGYYLPNGHGDVVGILDPAGAVQATYRYDAFGSPTAATGDFDNPFRYTAEPWDAEIGAIYLRARYYQPALGRFLTQDTHRGDPWQPWTQNLYVYVGNNPLNYVDPTGHDAVPKGPAPDIAQYASQNPAYWVLWNLWDSGYDYSYSGTLDAKTVQTALDSIQKAKAVASNISWMGGASSAGIAGGAMLGIKLLGHISNPAGIGLFLVGVGAGAYDSYISQPEPVLEAAANAMKLTGASSVDIKLTLVVGDLTRATVTITVVTPKGEVFTQTLADPVNIAPLNSAVEKAGGQPAQ